MHSVFHMKLYILVKWEVLSLVDLTEYFLFSFQLAKIFGNTTFVSIKYQCSSEFFQIGMPHFSLEGVTFVSFLTRPQVGNVLEFSSCKESRDMKKNRDESRRRIETI